MRGQGVGSTLLGVAAALHHANEHGRGLCVAWKAFELAFANSANCPSKDAYFVGSGSGGTAILDVDATFEEWSFGMDDEARAASDTRRDALLNSSRSVVVMHGDGGGIRSGSRLRFPFAPRDELISLLSPPRSLVVHLRQGDPHEGQRRGYLSDPSALTTLYRELPREAYCLSDAEEVYSSLCDRFACPSWRTLPHSSERAMRPSVGEQRRATLQTWADWWAIQTASGIVLHTPSAFSESALLFNAEVTPCVLSDAASAAKCLAKAAEAVSIAKEHAAQRLEL